MKRGDGYSVINGKAICYGCQEEDSWAAESDYQNAADFDLNRYYPPGAAIEPPHQERDRK